jgi:hypothetical protein
MATVRHLGLLPNVCFPFREREQLKWRQTFLEAEPIDLGVAPENAYLKLTKEEAVAVFWRVKEWEVSWGFSAKSINQTITQDFGDGDFGYYAHSFFYPEKNTSIIIPASHLFDNQTSEKNLVCTSFDPITNNGGDNFLSISSTENQTFSDPEGNPPQDFNHSRGVISGNNFAIRIFDFFNEQESGYDFDVALINDILYWPFTIDYFVEIADENNDGFLFNESGEANPDPFGAISGTVPRIGGVLTNVPRGSSPDPVISEYKAYFHIPNPSSKIIEFDLYDVSDTTPLSQTRFNVDGFTGITIKPKSYWPYDPEDGGGPIYDTATGAQLRDFPSS